MGGNGPKPGQNPEKKMGVGAGRWGGGKRPLGHRGMRGGIGDLNREEDIPVQLGKRSGARAFSTKQKKKGGGGGL